MIPNGKLLVGCAAATRAGETTYNEGNFFGFLNFRREYGSTI